MSLRIKKAFGERSNKEILEPKRKFIFGFEGYNTEIQYFQGIIDSREELEIDDLIEFILLERDDPSESNQLKVVKEINNFLKEAFVCKNSIKNIQERVKGILINDNIIIDSEIEDLIEDISDDNESFKVFLENLETKMKENKVLYKIRNLGMSLEIDLEYDEINIILDRDSESFTESQFDEVIEICNTNNYNLGLSNPNFEFWLLLHHDDCLSFKKNEIKENKKVNGRKRFLEKCLSNKLGGYNKRQIKFNQFKKNIPIAIENEKNFCEDNEMLKDEIGSSIGLIVKKFI